MNFKELKSEKLDLLIDIKKKVNNSLISVEKANEILKEKIDKVSPYEIAYIEQKLQLDPSCINSDIFKMFDLYEGLIDRENIDLDETHPIYNYYYENKVIKQTIERMKSLLKKEPIVNEWYSVYDDLREYKIHYARKQNQLYAFLEKAGFDRPNKIMWDFDNFITDMISKNYNLLKKNKLNEFINNQKEFIEYLEDLILKEETILYPTSLAIISNKEFEKMEKGDRQIGYAFLEREEESNFSNKQEGELEVSTGLLTLEQINLIFKNMPVDISYVDENDIVKFYTDTKERVFPRSISAIGRNVYNCHPSKSIHIVKEIIEKFRSGKEDEVDFWINKEDTFIYITYKAVRDENGKFRGVLEMMQDATHIRSLKGNQTLLNFEKSNIGCDLENIDDEIKEETTSILLDENTKVKDLLNKYPYIKPKLITISEKFKILDTPLGKLALRKAKISDMSYRTNIPVDEIIKKLNDLIKEG